MSDAIKREVAALGINPEGGCDPDEVVALIVRLQAAERERCAKLCNEAKASIWELHDPTVKQAAENVCENLAARIRRGACVAASQAPLTERQATLEADAWIKFAAAAERIGQKLFLSEGDALALRDAIDRLSSVLMRDPPAQVPLTDDALADIWNEHMGWGRRIAGYNDFVQAARAIERAHGIGEPT